MSAAEPSSIPPKKKHPPDSKVHQSSARLAEYMGFSQVDHMLSWFGSKKVMPFVKDLWHDCVKDREKRRTGPKLSQIKKVIDDDEGTGEERFDIHTPEPRDSWAEIDHVAYFVTRLMQANMEGKIGIFWKKDFSKDERYDRILQVYLHWSNVRFPEKREAALNIEPPPDSFTLQAANNEEGTRESDTGMTLNARGGIGKKSFQDFQTEVHEEWELHKLEKQRALLAFSDGTDLDVSEADWAAIQDEALHCDDGLVIRLTLVPLTEDVDGHALEAKEMAAADGALGLGGDERRWRRWTVWRPFLRLD